jgi:hypothetical protein
MSSRHGFLFPYLTIMNSNVKIAIGLLILIAVLYYFTKDSAVQNEGSVAAVNIGSKPSTSSGVGDRFADADSQSYQQSATDPSDWDAQFANSNQVTDRSVHETNDEYAPVDETSGAYASYRPYKKSKSGGSSDPATDDGWALYDAEEYMPQEKVDEWFETYNVPQQIKNQHLLSNQMGYGVDTKQQSMKIANMDLRPAPPCPKFVVSIFNQSTAEPDYNRKTLC